MTTQKHTPGPWQVEDYRSQGDWRSTGIIWAREPDSYLPGTKICSVNCDRLHSESGKEKIEEFEANARLIAAAPELLEALEECIADEDFANINGSGALSPEAVRKAKAAINKAKGREP